MSPTRVPARCPLDAPPPDMRALNPLTPFPSMRSSSAPPLYALALTTPTSTDTCTPQHLPSDAPQSPADTPAFPRRSSASLYAHAFNPRPSISRRARALNPPSMTCAFSSSHLDVPDAHARHPSTLSTPTLTPRRARAPSKRPPRIPRHGRALNTLTIHTPSSTPAALPSSQLPSCCSILIYMHVLFPNIYTLLLLVMLVLRVNQCTCLFLK